MKTAVITLSEHGARLAEAIADALGECDVYVHRQVTCLPDAWRFERVAQLTQEIFSTYRGLVFVLPCGVAVRAIAPCIKHKTTDPAVVAVDVGGRWAVSLLSGHEGGANELAVRVANVVDAEPVVSTTTEAVKDIIAGIGCRRGVESDPIIAALDLAVKRAGVSLSDVRLLASADIKRDEAGLLDAAQRLGIPLRLVTSQAIRESNREFARSEFVEDKVNLPAVAEPAALLAGRRTTLLLPKQIVRGVTVALARERFMWSG